MSELIDARKQTASLRYHLLANTSLLALLGYVSLASTAVAQPDGNRPTVWIELGGQLEKVEGEHEIFTPSFFQFGSPEVDGALVEAQHPYRYGTGFEGKVSIEPRGSDWIVSAALRYGRANTARHSHYQTSGLPTYGLFHIKPNDRIFADSQTNYVESHLVLDFKAGKDVGLGMFGSSGSSILSAGVRYAQFTSRGHTLLNAKPVLGHETQRGIGTYGLHKYGTYIFQFHRSYTAVLKDTRSTKALGPSLSWDSSVSVAGNPDAATVALDWGVNASVLFGKQRTQVDQQVTGYYFGHAPTYIDSSGAKRVKNFVAGRIIRTYVHPAQYNRSRSVTIPNVGGFAGVSLHFPNAKVSLGYRADFFFNASDQGIDVRDAANRNFYGPFATISIGLGG